MPYRSKAQMRLFFAKEQKGELPLGTARRWAHHTNNLKKLPQHVKHKEQKGQRKRAALLELAAAGDETARLVLEVLKKAAIGRHEGYGATNGLMTSRSNLLSPTNLARPQGGAAGVLAIPGGSMNTGGPQGGTPSGQAGQGGILATPGLRPTTTPQSISIPQQGLQASRMGFPAGQ